MVNTQTGGSFWDGLGHNFNNLLGVVIDSQREPKPVPTNVTQGQGANTDPAQDAAGNAVATPKASVMDNPNVMYAIYGFIALLVLLILLKVFGVI